MKNIKLLYIDGAISLLNKDYSHVFYVLMAGT